MKVIAKTKDGRAFEMEDVVEIITEEMMDRPQFQTATVSLHGAGGARKELTVQVDAVTITDAGGFQLMGDGVVDVTVAKPKEMQTPGIQADPLEAVALALCSLTDFCYDGRPMDDNFHHAEQFARDYLASKGLA